MTSAAALKDLALVILEETMVVLDGLAASSLLTVAVGHVTAVFLRLPVVAAVVVAGVV